jgi:hypothetical protein
MHQQRREGGEGHGSRLNAMIVPLQTGCHAVPTDQPTRVNVFMNKFRDWMTEGHSWLRYCARLPIGIVPVVFAVL